MGETLVLGEGKPVHTDESLSLHQNILVGVLLPCGEDWGGFLHTARFAPWTTWLYGQNSLRQ
jgi:hypothetical protein